MLPTGNSLSKEYRQKTSGGFSFIEVMVTLAILAIGIVAIYRSFLINLSAAHHLSCRHHAMFLMDNRITMMQKIFETKKQIPFLNRSDGEQVMVNNSPVYFRYEMDFQNVGEFKNIYALNLRLAWEENHRAKQLSRSVYILHPGPIDLTDTETSF